jgi:hypothetical protein
MRAGAIHHASGVRAHKSLVVRGGLVHTFGGLAGFLGVTFLCWGLYILEEAFADPLDPGAAALICGAFILTLAATLLFFLIKPRKRPRPADHDRAIDSPVPAARPLFNPVATAVRQNQNSLRNDLPYQRFYVDHSCIRP